MAGRQKEPVALLKAKGNSHYTPGQLAEREANEIKVDLIDIQIPEYLNEKQKKKFKDIADKLLHIQIMTELDEDCLARYVMAEENYLAYNRALNKALKNDEPVAAIEKIQSMQDKAFKQCNACARELGLTISSRCKLIAPVVQGMNPTENKFKKFQN